MTITKKKGKNERMRISFTILIIMKSPCLPHKAFSSSALQMQCVRTTFNIQVCFHFTTKWLNSQGNPVSLEHETPTVKIHFHQNEKLQHGAQIFSKHISALLSLDALPSLKRVQRGNQLEVWRWSQTICSEMTRYCVTGPSYLDAGKVDFDFF